MAPRPQQFMNERRHQENSRSNMSESLAAPVAAKPKEETFYESLLRYHEDEDDDGEIQSTNNTCDEEDDRKLPAKPTPVHHRSKSHPVRPFFQGSYLDAGLRLTEPVDESHPLTTREHEVAFAEASLYSDLSALHQKSLDERFESNIARPPPVLRHQQARSDSLSSRLDEYPLAPHVECAVHDDSLHSDSSSFQRMTSFYKSALEASGEQHSSLLAKELIAEDEDEKLARDLAREVDESLARELARKLELEDSLPDSQVADPGQLKIMQAIRKEAERREIEKALQDSGTGLSPDFDSGIFGAIPRPPGTTAPPQVDFLLSQQLAMEEWQQVPRSPVRRSRSLAGRREHPHHVSFEHYMPHSSDESEPRSSLEEDSLLQQGNRETREAIANGMAHVVQCRGCLGRLHAPMSYALVYCPKCHYVSPGQTYVARDDRASLRRERSKGL